MRFKTICGLPSTPSLRHFGLAGHPPPTNWTISSRSPVWIGTFDQFERGAITPLCSTATRSALRFICSTTTFKGVGDERSSKTRVCPLTVRLSGITIAYQERRGPRESPAGVHYYTGGSAAYAMLSDTLPEKTQKSRFAIFHK
jgi:hypothetical protein